MKNRRSAVQRSAGQLFDIYCGRQTTGAGLEGGRPSVVGAGYHTVVIVRLNIMQEIV